MLSWARSELADVDAITLSLTELHRSETSSAVATGGIVLAVGTNTLVKAGVRVGSTMLALLAVGSAGMAVSVLATND